jgi:hypothetical protein
MNRRLLKIAKWFFGIVLGVFLLVTVGLYFFKDTICGYVVNEVNKHLKAKVTVAEVDLTFWASFPNLSVDFNDVFIQDSYENSTIKDTLLFSHRIRLKFDPMDIWNENYKVKSIEVDPGTIKLKVRKNGEVNYDILKPKKESKQSAFELNLQQVTLQDIRFSYRNAATNQYYLTKFYNLELQGDFSEKSYRLHAKSNLKVHTAKSGKVTLISNKPAFFDLTINVNSETFEIPKAIVYVAKLPFELKGNVTKDWLHFEIHSANIQLVDVVNNFSVAQVDEIKKFAGTGAVYFNLFIDGERKPTSPTEINCDFGIKNGSLTEPTNKLKLNNVNLAGKYSNKGGAEKEFLKLSDIRFSTAGGPFSGNVLLTQFAAPIVKGNANGVINLKILHSLFHLPYVDNVSGNIGLQTNFNVKGTLQTDNSINYSIQTCEGEIQLKNIDLKMVNDKRLFHKVNGAMYLRNDEVGIDNVSLEIGKTDIAMNGVFKNIFNYLKKQGDLKAEVEIKSNYLDVADLGTTTKEEKIKDGRDFVLPDNIVARVFMEVGDLTYQNHEFKRLSGNLIVGKRKLYFPDISLQNADADIRGTLTIEEKSPEIFNISTQVATDNLLFKSLFKEWNNFNQNAIGENNIFGKAQAKVYFEAPFDLRAGIISRSIKSQVYLKITDGRLKDVAAFKSITENLKTGAAKLAIGKGNIAGLERKLLDLKFETLENTFTIQNGQLEIPTMLIHTSVLDIETSGTHTFDNRIDYRFAFRFRDLKDKNTVSEFGEEEDDGTGLHVFMRMFGALDNPTIIWDKTAKKEQAKENRKAEKENVKSIFKTEFGIFKGDTTVKTYQPKEKPKEVLQVEFGTIKTEDIKDPVKQKKDSKLKNTLKNWKQESDKSKQEEIEFN